MYSASDVNQCSIFFLRVRMSVHGCNIKMRKIKNGERERGRAENWRVVSRILNITRPQRRTGFGQRCIILSWQRRSASNVKRPLFYTSRACYFTRRRTRLREASDNRKVPLAVLV